METERERQMGAWEVGRRTHTEREEMTETERERDDDDPRHAVRTLAHTVSSHLSVCAVSDRGYVGPSLRKPMHRQHGRP